MKTTHRVLVTLGTLLGYLNLKKGLCAGFSGMWLQAVFAQDWRKLFIKGWHLSHAIKIIYSY